MRDRTLITTGAIGAVLAAICCMTPLLVVVFGAVGLTAWLAKADYVLIPALILCLARRLRPLSQTPAPRMKHRYPTEASDIRYML
jgi:Membrane transport protein MerF